MHPAEERLVGWKEIAGFLDVSVKTAQNWEKGAGLPVRRFDSGNRSRVWAYRNEVQNWLDSQTPSPKSNRRLYLGLLPLAVLMALLTWLAFPELRCSPARWELHGQLLRTFDGSGRVCWEALLDRPLVRSAYEPGAQSGLRHRPVVIYDLQQDGKNEVLFNLADAKQDRSSLVCFEEDGSIRWEVDYGRAIVGPDGRSFGPEYGHDFTVPVLEGRAILTIGRNVPYFPSQVALRSPEDGSVIHEYWHPGEITDVAVSDLDGDAKDELVLAGINNPGPGPGHAAIWVLELPPQSSNLARAESNYFGPENALEKWYALAPRPDTLQALDKSSKAFKVKVRHGGTVEFAVGSAAGATYGHYTVSPTARHSVFRPADRMSEQHAELELRGNLDHALNNEELEVLGRLLWFPTAPDGNDPEVEAIYSPVDDF